MKFWDFVIGVTGVLGATTLAIGLISTLVVVSTQSPWFVSLICWGAALILISLLVYLWATEFRGKLF